MSTDSEISEMQRAEQALVAVLRAYGLSPPDCIAALAGALGVYAASAEVCGMLRPNTDVLAAASDIARHRRESTLAHMQLMAMPSQGEA